MGAGRRTHTYIVDSRAGSGACEPSGCPPNFKHSQRGLGEKLGGVIFGCTNETYDECVNGKVFGLPRHHIIYVKDIRPGLPLFLFNYSGRKLYGVFRAVSEGGLEINPHGWTGGTERKTSFPAQVRVEVFKKCEPLQEKIFRKVIETNYSDDSRRFVFELDKSQVANLCRLFKSEVPRGVPRLGKGAAVAKKQSANMGKTSAPGAQSWKVENKASSNVEQSAKRKESEEVKLDPADFPSLGASVAAKSKTKPKSKPKLDAAMAKVNENGHGSSDTGKKKEKNSKGSKGVGGVVKKVVAVSNSSSSAKKEPRMEKSGGQVESKLKGKKTTVTTIEKASASPAVASALQNATKEVASTSVSAGANSSKTSKETKPLLSSKENVTADLITKGESVRQSAEASVDTKKQPDKDSAQQPAAPSPLMRRDEPVQSSAKESDAGPLQSKPEQQSAGVEGAENSGSGRQEFSDLGALSVLLANSTSNTGTSSAILEPPPGFQQRQLASQSGSSSPSAASPGYNSIALRDCASDSSSERLCLIGGLDQHRLVSTVEYFDPDAGEWESGPDLPCNGFVYGAATSLREFVYLIGGGQDACSIKSASYCLNVRTGKWQTIQGLMQSRASLGIACVNERIWAVGGGGPGRECSSVEIYDPSVDCWYKAPEMLSKRFSVGVGQSENVIYACGGFDGSRYLSTVERMDCREGKWKALPSMSQARGSMACRMCYSWLWVIGGFDSMSMLDCVEVFDPRKGTWHKMAAVNMPRGYCSAEVLDEHLYVIGGRRHKDLFQMAGMEKYNYHRSWWEGDLPAGKAGSRSFHASCVVHF